MNKTTSENIYAVKGLGAILIMIYHYSVYYSDYISSIEFKHLNFAYLTFAVPIFFLFSSFFLYGKAKKFEHPIKLIIYRLTRLYPMYWIAVLFSTGIIVFVGKQVISVKQILLNLTMIEKVFGVEHIDGAYWTLFYELMLLIIFAFASVLQIRKKKLIKNTLLFCSSWLILGAVSSTTMKTLRIESSTLAVILFACRYVPVFVMGILFSDRYKENKLVSNKQFWVLYICSIVYELVLAQNIYYGIYGVVAILVCHAATSGKLNRICFFKSSLLVSLGKISYNIYLCHNQFGKILISKIDRTDNMILSILIICLIGVGSILIAYILSKLEKIAINKIEVIASLFMTKRNNLNV